MLSSNTVLRDRYRIIHQLGHGGMGAVYQAMDGNLDCLVAVKETFAANDEQRRAFRREAELLANLSHPNLPRVTDHFTDGEGQFLVMQFVPGHDLAELLELREQPFPVAKVLDWADQILDALEDLHSSNPPIIHRDIKPANLKVTPKGRVLLLDFGLAKGAAGQMSTVDMDIHGKSIYGYTPNYAPIEQIRGAGTDPRSDQYSLAAALWTLLTGRVPPDAVTRMAEREEGNPDPLRPAHELNSQVPPSVSNALNRAAAVNRNHRYESATEMRRALRAARDADVEHATMPFDDAAPATLSVPPVEARPMASTIKTPEPVSESPTSSQRLRSTIKSPKADSPKTPDAAAQAVKTIGVDGPPNVPMRDEKVDVRTAFSIPPHEIQQVRAQKRLAIIVAASMILAPVGIVGLAVWRPWVASKQSNQTLSTQTNNTVTDTRLHETNTPPAPTATDGMVYVPGGTFTMGRNKNDGGDDYERPAHQEIVKPFFIDIYEVTNEDYDKFAKATNHKVPQTWTNGAYPAGHEHRPVTGVTWDDATDYASWIGKRLPTEEEWEFAARGTDERLYPWGKDWKEGSANANRAERSSFEAKKRAGASAYETANGKPAGADPIEKALRSSGTNLNRMEHLADVGSYKGASPFGVYDMVGNAWEWTASNFRAYPGGRLSANQLGGELKVIRGGSYESTKEFATTTYRAGWPARGAKTYDQTGFRCVQDVPK